MHPLYFFVTCLLNLHVLYSASHFHFSIGVPAKGNPISPWIKHADSADVCGLYTHLHKNHAKQISRLPTAHQFVCFSYMYMYQLTLI